MHTARLCFGENLPVVTRFPVGPFRQLPIYCTQVGAPYGDCARIACAVVVDQNPCSYARLLATDCQSCCQMLKAVTPIASLLTASVFLTGCLVIHPPCEISPDQDFYRTVATTPLPECGEVGPGGPGELPLSMQAPLTIDEKSPPPAWPMTLNEAVQLGLENSKVLRDLGGSVLRTPLLAQTIHDPAIQASDPRLGMDGALSAFDAQLSTSLFAYRNDRAFNNLFLGGGTFLFRQDLDNFVTELSKQTASGARVAVRHHIDYDDNNALANVFRSYFNTNYETEFRQPLLQGAGVDFNRIAGPNSTPGQINGVVIARINNDVSTAEFEIALRDYISNVENAYWDLYYAYRELDAKIAARDTSLDHLAHHPGQRAGRARLQQAAGSAGAGAVLPLPGRSARRAGRPACRPHPHLQRLERRHVSRRGRSAGCRAAPADVDGRADQRRQADPSHRRAAGRQGRVRLVENFRRSPGATPRVAAATCHRSNATKWS